MAGTPRGPRTRAANMQRLEAQIEGLGGGAGGLGIGRGVKNKSGRRTRVENKDLERMLLDDEGCGQRSNFKIAC